MNGSCAALVEFRASFLSNQWDHTRSPNTFCASDSVPGARGAGASHKWSAPSEVQWLGEKNPLVLIIIIIIVIIHICKRDIKIQVLQKARDCNSGEIKLMLREN